MLCSFLNECLDICRPVHRAPTYKIQLLEEAGLGLRHWPYEFPPAPISGAATRNSITAAVKSSKRMHPHARPEHAYANTRFSRGNIF